VRRVLVTGANGFVGRAVVPHLESRGWNVRSGVRSTLGDLGVAEPPAEALRDVDAVVHLANVPQVAGTPESAYVAVNVDGTRRLVAACLRHRVRRFVYVSSVKAMLDEGPATDRPLSEALACSPSDAYGRSKLAAEEVCRAAAPPLEVCVLRPPLVYGPGARGNVARLLRAVDRRLPLPLGAVRARRSMIFVGNLADAIAASLDGPAAAGETFLVRDAEDLTVREMVLRIGRLMGRHPLLLPFPSWSLELAGRLLGRSEDVRRLTRPLRVSSAKIENLLGWHPPWGVDHGLAETVSWHRGLRDRVRVPSEA
jgi:UDP-glucose 4-epimerase